MPSRQVEIGCRTRCLLASAEDGGTQLGDARRRFLIRHRVTERTEFIRGSADDILRQPVLSRKKKRFWDEAKDYVGSLPEHEAYLYNFQRGHVSGQVSSQPYRRSRRTGGCWIEVGVPASGERRVPVRNRTLPVVRCAEQPAYPQKEIREIGCLIKAVESGSTKRGDVIEVDDDGMFRSGTKQVWRLEEGRDIPMDREYDPVTGEDIYGFTEEETRPEEAVRALRETREVLAERFAA